MKEVEHPVIDALKLHAKLVNAIPEVIGFRPSQFVTELAKSLNLDSALVLGLSGQRVEPFQKGDGPVIIPIKQYARSRHPFLLIPCSYIYEQSSSVFLALAWSRGL
jgi:hypothetical protein